MSKERAKGTRYETEVVEFLRAAGYPAARNILNSPHGDISGLPGFNVECKNQREQRLGIWIDQSKDSAARRGTVPIVIHKRRMRPVRESYVTMTLADFVAFLKPAAET